MLKILFQELCTDSEFIFLASLAQKGEDEKGLKPEKKKKKNLVSSLDFSKCLKFLRNFSMHSFPDRIHLTLSF